MAGLAQWVQHYVTTIKGYAGAEFGAWAQLRIVAHGKKEFDVLEHVQRGATK